MKCLEINDDNVHVEILNLLQIGSLTKQHQLCKHLYHLEDNKRRLFKTDQNSLNKKKDKVIFHNITLNAEYSVHVLQIQVART